MTITRKCINNCLIVLHLVMYSMLYAQEGYKNYPDGAETKEVELILNNEIEHSKSYSLNPVQRTGGIEMHLAQSMSTSKSPSGMEDTPRAKRPSTASDNVVNQAVMEQIMLTELADSIPGEKTVGCFFIFRNKPSSFSYDVKKAEKKLIFVFNDTKVGASQFPSVSEYPIKGFTVEQSQISGNKRTAGPGTAGHSQIRVIFDLEAIPEFSVTDEKSIISFSFKWSSDLPVQKKTLAKRRLTPKGLLYSSIGVGGAAAVGLAVYLYREYKSEPEPSGEPLGKLSTTDLPTYPANFK